MICEQLLEGKPMPKSKLLFPALAAVGIAGYVTIAGLTGFCPTCQLVTNSVVGTSTPVALETSQPDGEDIQSNEPEVQNEFKVVSRPGSVDLDAAYNLSNLSIPRDEIHTLLPKDAIPALTDPGTELAKDSDYLNATSRIIVVEVEGDVLGVPIAILNFHEIVNTTVGGQQSLLPTVRSAIPLRFSIEPSARATKLLFSSSVYLARSTTRT